MKPAFLVIGGDGLIGHALALDLARGSYEVVVTSRRAIESVSGWLYIDLAVNSDDLFKNVAISDLVRQRPTIAVLAAAITNIADCTRDEPRSRLINVTKTVEIGKKLLSQGIDVVFLSSNAVFSGRNAYPTEDTEPDPGIVYGMQKAEAERELLYFHRSIAGQARLIIVRLTKVIHKSLPLLERWIENLRLGQSITAFQDRQFSPISLQYVVNHVVRIANSGRSGIYHLTGNSDLSYYDFAKLLAARLGVNTEIVKPSFAPHGAGLVQQHSALGVTRLGFDLMLEPETPDAVIQSLLQQEG